MTPDEFREALGRLSWSPQEAAERLRVDLRTVYRYLGGSRKIPGPVAVIIEQSLRGAP